MNDDMSGIGIWFDGAVARWTSLGPLPAFLLAVLVLAAGAALVYLIVDRGLRFVIARTRRLRDAGWSVTARNRRLAGRIAFLATLEVIRAGLPHLPSLPAGVVTTLQRLVSVILVFAMARVLATVLAAASDRHDARHRPGQRPIKGYVQVVTLVGYLFAVVVSVGILLDRDPLVLLTGIGAASAVLLLIFQNTILSFVAGIQLTADDLIRVGDWIEMPEMNADGAVKEIALNTVTVQNSDMSLTIIPAHNFLGKSFKNWRGMQDAGVRRMKRSVDIDVSSIRFLTDEEVRHLGRFALLEEYLVEKQAEIEAWTAANPAAAGDVVNSRRLTNVGTFRAYMTRYLMAHAGFAKDRTLIVRQLQPGAGGLPMEMYAFVNGTDWAAYEGVQADVLDHLIAILPEFGLRLFQAPSGTDVRERSVAAHA